MVNAYHFQRLVDRTIAEMRTFREDISPNFRIHSTDAVYKGGRRLSDWKINIDDVPVEHQTWQWEDGNYARYRQHMSVPLGNKDPNLFFPEFESLRFL